MRTRVALLLVAALALGACTSEGTDPDPAATETSTSTASEAGGRTDLPSGIVATVGDEEITIEVLDARLAVIREIPDVKSQLEADGGDALEPRLKARALGELVLQKVVLQAAADEGVEVTDTEREAKRAELVEAAGGEDAFAEQLASAGVPEDQFPGDLSASIAFEKVIDQLAAEQGIDPDAAAATPTEEATTEEATTEPASEGATTEPASTSTDTASPSESETTSVAQQIADIKREWLTRILTDADVAVDYVFGTWDPTTGQVQPPR